DHLEEIVIKLYQTGVTTREISDIIKRMYGDHLFLSGSLVTKRL
ncbi:TPA: transposase, partial [Streptococcus pyogenes]|nr:transposase [Streptococcus pyogenes]